jgi:hypothetical protein
MKIVTKTPRKVVLEVGISKIDRYGFDFVWDEIRDKFPEGKFGKFKIEEDLESENVVFELISIVEVKKKKAKVKSVDPKKISVSILEKEIKKG